MSKLFKTLLMFLLFFMNAHKAFSQSLESIPIASNLQGEWVSEDPLILSNTSIKSFALSLDGSMRVKVLYENSPLEGNFNYLIDSIMGNLSIEVKSIAIGLNINEKYSFPLRRRHDGSIELEYKGKSHLYSKINLPNVPPSSVKPSSIAEFESIEKIINKKNLYDGSKISSNQALQSARNRAAPDPSVCPKGSLLRKSEDVRTYLKNQEDLQSEISTAIEKFTAKTIKKNEAVDLFNRLINQSNEITKWSWGKVTNGTCGPVEITKLIGKSSSTTKTLFIDFRSMIENN